MKCLNETFAEAWEARVNLDFEKCLALLAEIKQRLDFPVGELVEGKVEALLREKVTGERVEALLLCASLARALGDAVKADILLAALDRVAGGRPELRSFRLFYEKGRGAFSRGDFHGALEEYLRASFLAQEDCHRLWALGNVLFCMENLGLPYERTLVEVRALCLGQPSGSGAKRVQTQLHAFELRALFREGGFRALFEAEEKRPVIRLDQGRYFSFWARLLPYHAYHRELRAEEVELFAVPSALHFPFYKLRTLQGMLHPEDLKGHRPSEGIDRFYLWVWRWLCAPDAFPAQRLLAFLQETDWKTLLYRCTVEDGQLLRNALLWLGLFDPVSEGLLKEFLAVLPAPRATREYPLLLLESHVVQYFHALRRGEECVARDFRATLESHPLWRSKELRFRRLVESVERPELEEVQETGLPHALSALQATLRAATRAGSRSGGASVLVDMGTCQIVDRRRATQTVSEPMCRALRLLGSADRVDCDEFMQVCFGLSEFDPLVHNGKIFNLLSRLKKVVGETPSFHLKAGAVQAKGDWSHIEFRDAGTRVSLVPLLMAWKRGSLVAEAPAAPRARNAIAPPRILGDEALRKWDWSDGLTRADVERRLGAPRSTTNRLLAKWVAEGALRVKGRARSTRYFLKLNGKGHHETSSATRDRSNDRHRKHGRPGRSGGGGQDHFRDLRETGDHLPRLRSRVST